MSFFLEGIEKKAKSCCHRYNKSLFMIILSLQDFYIKKSRKNKNLKKIP